MTHGLRIRRRASGRPHSRLAFAPLLLLAPYPALAQDTAAPTLPDTDAPLDAMPDIGLDWPDMYQPDSVAPLAPDPADQAGAPIEAFDVTTTEPAEVAATFADAGEERRYTVALTGLDGVADTTFRQRFDELSVLHQGEDKAANLAQEGVAQTVWDGCSVDSDAAHTCRVAGLPAVDRNEERCQLN